MASPSSAPKPLSQKRLSLAEIDAVVSAKLGPTRPRHELVAGARLRSGVSITFAIIQRYATACSEFRKCGTLILVSAVCSVSSKLSWQAMGSDRSGTHQDDI